MKIPQLNRKPQERDRLLLAYLGGVAATAMAVVAADLVRRGFDTKVALAEQKARFAGFQAMSARQTTLATRARRRINQETWEARVALAEQGHEKLRLQSSIAYDKRIAAQASAAAAELRLQAVEVQEETARLINDQVSGASIEGAETNQVDDTDATTPDESTDSTQAQPVQDTPPATPEPSPDDQSAERGGQPWQAP